MKVKADQIIRNAKIFTSNKDKLLASALVVKDGKFIYVSISDVRYWDWYNDVLIRTMAHDKDWHGGSNNRCAFNEIGDTALRLHQWQMRQVA